MLRLLLLQIKVVSIYYIDLYAKDDKGTITNTRFQHSPENITFSKITSVPRNCQLHVDLKHLKVSTNCIFFTLIEPSKISNDVKFRLC